MGAGVWLGFVLLFKNRAQGALAASVFLMFFYSYGPFFRTVEGQTILGRPLDDHTLLLSLLSFVLLVTLVLIRRAKNIAAYHRAAGTVALILIGAAVFNMATFELKAIAWSKNRNSAGWTEAPVPRGTKEKPDIFYIVVDAYTRSDVLKKKFDYDNSEFIDFLRNKGFYVAPKANSNYAQTYLSLASSLNSIYLSRLESEGEVDPHERRIPIDMIRQSRIFRYARSQGYTLVNFSSGYARIRPGDVDAFLSAPGSMSEFQTGLLEMTPITAISRSLWKSETAQFEAHRRGILFPLDHVADWSGRPSPVFVFAHILAPHPPFVFGAQGEKLDSGDYFALADGSHYMAMGGNSEESYRQGYREQNKFVTAKLSDMIERILNRKNRPAIIIIQGDHGSGMGLDHESRENTDIKERFAILNALYFPDSDYSRLYPSISPVNTFRVILQQFAGVDIDKLPDRSYFSPFSRPYNFQEVTEKLRGQ